ncbi:SPOR domain-containing protein [Aurantivibrio infirmus]
MRWIVMSLVGINVLVLALQLVMPNKGVSESSPVNRATDLGNAPTIKLLRELDRTDRQSPIPLTAEASPQVSEEEQALCTFIGPFPKMLRADYFVERLDALELEPTIQELEIPGENGYWVYLPPLAARKAANDMWRELQAKGIDSYVILKGELENGISFGMFSQQKLAEQRLKDMKANGYAAELQEITRSYKENWVVLPPGQAKIIGAEAWSQMLSSDEGLERRQNFCPPVASQ